MLPANKSTPSMQHAWPSGGAISEKCSGRAPSKGSPCEAVTRTLRPKPAKPKTCKQYENHVGTVALNRQRQGPDCGTQEDSEEQGCDSKSSNSSFAKEAASVAPRSQARRFVTTRSAWARRHCLWSSSEPFASSVPLRWCCKEMGTTAALDVAPRRSHQETKL